MFLKKNLKEVKEDRLFSKEKQLDPQLTIKVEVKRHWHDINILEYNYQLSFPAKICFKNDKNDSKDIFTQMKTKSFPTDTS